MGIIANISLPNPISSQLNLYRFNGISNKISAEFFIVGVFLKCIVKYKVIGQISNLKMNKHVENNLKKVLLL